MIFVSSFYFLFFYPRGFRIAGITRYLKIVVVDLEIGKKNSKGWNED